MHEGAVLGEKALAQGATRGARGGGKQATLEAGETLGEKAMAQAAAQTGAVRGEKAAARAGEQSAGRQVHFQEEGIARGAAAPAPKPGLTKARGGVAFDISTPPQAPPKPKPAAPRAAEVSGTSGPSGNGRAGRQARLKELAQDDKLGRADRGWLNQEKNAIARGSKRMGRTGELKEQKNIRVPPGKELAHRRAKAAKDGYGYEHADLQGHDLHKLQHKHEGYN